MANEEAMEYGIDQLIAMNRVEDEEVELRQRPAENVTQTDAEKQLRTSRRLTFGGQDYKTPAAAKAALDDLHEQLEGLEKTVSQSLDDSRGNEDPNSDSDSDDISDLGKPIDMQEAVLEIDAAGLPANLAMSTQTMLMGTIDLEELNPKFREIGENNCRSMKQAADWFRKSDPSTPDKPNQLDKLKASAKAGGAPAIAEIQNTLTWL